MRRIITTILIACMILCSSLALTACSKGPVGYWQIESVTAGDVVMTQEDAASIGMSTVGAIKLQKSGNCVVELLGDEYEGTWEQAEDGALTITYGDDALVLKGAIDEEGTMKLADDQGQEYVLNK